MGKLYKHYREGKSFDEAQQVCERDEAMLATFRTQKDYTAMLSFAMNTTLYSELNGKFG